jgi:preprotein translocase subunit SecB
MADDRDDAATPSTEGEAPGTNHSDGQAADPNPSGIPKTANPGTRPEPPYQIMRQYVKDFSFENPGAPEIFLKGAEPQAKISIDVQSKPLGGRDVEVVITVEAAGEHDGETAYLLELSYGAIARIGQVPKEALNALLLVEIPRMLFPFVREIVCDATRSGGFSMLLLAPFDFVDLYRTRLAQEQAAQGEAAGTA